MDLNESVWCGITTQKPMQENLDSGKAVKERRHRRHCKKYIYMYNM